MYLRAFEKKVEHKQPDLIFANTVNYILYYEAESSLTDLGKLSCG
jgi:hypothetical protein